MHLYWKDEPPTHILMRGFTGYKAEGESSDQAEGAGQELPVSGPAVKSVPAHIMRDIELRQQEAAAQKTER